MNLKELRERVNALATELGTLAQKDQRTDDEETRLDAVLAEFNDLAPKLERENAVAETNARAGKLQEHRGSLAGIVPHGDLDGDGNPKPVDRRSAGRRFAESDEVKAWIERGGKQSAPVKVGAMDARAADGSVPEYHDGQAPVEARTLIYSGVQPGMMVQPMVVPGIFRPRDYALRMRDVLVNGRTTSDAIYFLRELVFTNAAAEVAEATATGGASGLKPEAALTFEEASAAVKTIAHWLPITRQMIADAPQLQTYVEGRLLVGLERRLNSQIINGDGSGATLTGILSTTGIQALDGAYFTGAAVNDAGTDNENFNRVLRANTLIETVGDAEATFVALNPTDLEQFQTRTDGQRQYLGGGPFDAAPVPRLWGLPVVRERAVTAGTAIVGDGTMAAVWDREDARIMIDTINDQFVRNMLTILAELRAALTVFRPAAFAEVTLAAWA